VDEMGNASEIIAQLARDNAYREVLLMAQECKNLEELIEKLKAKVS